MSKSKSITVSALIVTIGFTLSKVLGFLREAVLAYSFGATKVTDAYIISLTIPTFILLGLGGALTTAVIPISSSLEKEKGKAAVYKTISILINISTVFSALMILVSYLGIGTIVQKLAPGFEPETLKLAIRLTSILLPTAVISMVSTIINTLLQYNGDFSVVALSGFLQNTIVIAVILTLSEYMGIVSAALGTVGALILITIFQLIRLSKIGYKHYWIIDIKDEGFIRIIKMTLPIIIAAPIAQIGAMIIRGIGTGLVEGTVTFISYAQKLILMPYSIIGTSIVTVFYPTIARQYHMEGKAEFFGSLYRSMSTMFFALAPITAGAMLLSNPLVRIVYQRGAFTSEMASATSIVMMYLAISVPFMGIADLFAKAIYVMQDTLLPLIVSITATAASAMLALSLAPRLSYIGLAIAMSAQYIISVVLAGFLFYKKYKRSWNDEQQLSQYGVGHSNSDIDNFMKKLAISLIKTIIATAVMSGIVFLAIRLLGSYLPTSNLVGTIITVSVYAVIGSISYILAAAILKADELMFLLRTATGILKKVRQKFGAVVNE